MPYRKLNADGILIEPPISVPTPMIPPRRPIIAPSPPELPPHDQFLLRGFVVLPMMLLTVSQTIKV
jgi:hypothetical protein